MGDFKNDWCRHNRKMKYEHLSHIASKVAVWSGEHWGHPALTWWLTADVHVLSSLRSTASHRPLPGWEQTLTNHEHNLIRKPQNERPFLHRQKQNVIFLMNIFCRVNNQVAVWTFFPLSLFSYACLMAFSCIYLCPSQLLVSLQGKIISFLLQPYWYKQHSVFWNMTARKWDLSCHQLWHLVADLVQ